MPPRPPAAHEKKERSAAPPAWQKFADFAKDFKDGVKEAAGNLPEDFRRFLNEARAFTPRSGRRASSAMPRARGPGDESTPEPESDPFPPKPEADRDPFMPRPGANPYQASPEKARKPPPTPRAAAQEKPREPPRPPPRPQARARCASADPRARPRPEAQAQQAQEQVFAAVRQEVKLLRKADPAKRKRELHKLFLRWHPDKNPNDMEFATKVFQHIQEELRRK